jgi:hypothetical protein
MLANQTCLNVFANMPETNGPVRSYPLYCTPLLFLKPHVMGEFIEAPSS